MIKENKIMKCLITMLAVSIFSCATIAQTPRLKADKVGHVFSPETWGKKEWKELGSSRKLWQEKKAPVRHDVPIVCGTKDGECGVKDCKCSCHKKDARKHTHKKSASKGRTSKGKRGSRRSGHKGRSHRSSGKRGSSRRSHSRSHARKGPPTKKAKDAKEVRDARKKRVQDSNKVRGGDIRKRIEEWRKNFNTLEMKKRPSNWLIAKKS